jgi:AcrR family transcriptional regulator
MKKSNTKDKIIEKATDLFYKHGFVKASIRDIVRAVGVTNSTFYSHYKNKDEILYTIIENIGSILQNMLLEATEMYDDPVDCLKEMIFRQVCLISARGKEIKVYIEEQYQLPAHLRKKALRQHRQIYNIYFNKIKEIQNKGLIADIDTTVTTYSIFAMMNWSYRWFRENGRLSIEEVAENIIRIFLGGIMEDKRWIPREHAMPENKFNYREL